MKVLIIKLRYIGDTLTLLPVVRAIKEHEPAARVSVMIYKGTEGILACQKKIDEIILVDRKEIKDGNFFTRLRNNLKICKDTYQKGFDIVIDLTSSDRSGFLSWVTRAPVRIGAPLGNLWESFAYTRLIEGDSKKRHIIDYQLDGLKSLGFEVPKADTSIYVPEEIEGKIRSQWAAVIDANPLVVIHPGARGVLRRWNEERFARIADRLIETYKAHILLIGGPGEEEILDQVESHMARKPDGKTTGLLLIEMAALLKQARLFIGNDTATGHIAAGVGAPHIVLFGPTFPRLWAPRGAKGVSIFKSPDCCGCRQISCLKSDDPCMNWITVEDVWGAVRELL